MTKINYAVAVVCVAVCLLSAITFYKVIQPTNSSANKPEPVECQRIYAKAKACIEMESLNPDGFKYNP